MPSRSANRSGAIRSGSGQAGVPIGAVQVEHHEATQTEGRRPATGRPGPSSPIGAERTARWRVPPDEPLEGRVVGAGAAQRIGQRRCSDSAHERNTTKRSTATVGRTTLGSSNAPVRVSSGAPWRSRCSATISRARFAGTSRRPARTSSIRSPAHRSARRRARRAHGYCGPTASNDSVMAWSRRSGRPLHRSATGCPPSRTPPRTGSARSPRRASPGHRPSTHRVGVARSRRTGRRARPARRGPISPMNIALRWRWSSSSGRLFTP